MNPFSTHLDHAKMTTPESYTKITFPDGNSALAIHVATHANSQEIFQQLKLDFPTALIVLSGGADGLNELDKTSQQRLIQLFSRGIVRIATELGVGFISGGTDSGVMAILGQTAAERGCKSPLIGIAPAMLTTYPDQATPSADQKNLVALEPNHSHFVLVETEQWGKETEVMYDLAAIFAKQIPVFTLLVNGGKLSQAEILRSVRLGLAIIVIEGSGRLADEIATLYRNPPKFIEDPVLAEIIADGKIHLFPLQGEVSELGRLIYKLYRQLRGDTILKIAWRQFGLYDFNANKQQRNFNSIQLAMISLGVGGTLLAVLQATLEQQKVFEVVGFGWLEHFLRYTIMVIPITTAALLAAANRFSAGNKWILLRNSAEQIKSEIFRYRAQAEIYSPEETVETSRESKFSEKLQNIGHQLMQTEVNISALQAYLGVIPPPYSTAPNDNGLSLLKPERYISARLEDQLFYYVKKAHKLEQRLKSLQWLIYIIGGVGTLLAALKQELWIAVTTALVTALGTYLEYQQVEKNLRKYNQAATDLFNVRTWWIALSDEEQTHQTNIDLLVSRTERVLQSEFTGWLKEMQEAIIELKEKQSKGEEQKISQEKFPSPPIIAEEIPPVTEENHGPP